MRNFDPHPDIMAVWDSIDHAPWIELNCSGLDYSSTVYYQMVNTRRGDRQNVTFERHMMYRLSDGLTARYITGKLCSALDDVNRNTVEAGTGSIDVYREDV